tara:strand:+ start:6021 stop:6170 length:150 start_codon:yes stop_codon:yes gene_type:complete
MEYVIREVTKYELLEIIDDEKAYIVADFDTMEEAEEYKEECEQGESDAN